MLPILIVGFTVIANFVIAAVVFFNNRKSATNLLLALLSIINAGWALFTYLALFSGPEEVRLFWVRTVMFITSSFGPVIFLLAEVFPGPQLKVKKSILVAAIVLPLLTAIAAVTPTMFTRLENLPEGNFRLYPGPTIVLYGINLIVFMVWGFITLIRKYRQSQGLRRAQTVYFLLGLIVTFALATLTNFIAVVVFGTIRFTYIGPPLTLILVGAVAYAIVKHRLLDIRFLVARTISYTLLLLVIASGYALLLFAISSLAPAWINRNFVYVILTLVVAFTFNPLRVFIDKITERLFYKGRYDTEELLSELTLIMASEIDIRILSERLLSTLTSQMRLTKGAFIVVNKDGSRLPIVKNHGGEEFQFTDQELSKFSGKEDILIFDELEEGDIKETLRKYEVTIFMLLRTKESLVGYLVIGPKASGDIYSGQDIEVLGIFGPQAAVALQNAESYQEIQEFSRTLEKKVEERTAQLKETQERELAKAQELLKLKDEFVFIATHDLKTPVTAIDGFVKLIEMSKEKLSEETQDSFQAIVQASDRLKQLVNDLLQVARSESGTVKVELAPVDIVTLVESLVREVTPMASDKKVKVSANLDKEVKMVMADEAKLKEIVENLLSNAIKFSKEGGSVEVISRKDGDNLAVSVSDTGYGIPKVEQAKIFQKFFRYRGDETKDVPGTGLGLFVVRMLVEKMGGKITFTSEEGKGTTFTFTLAVQ